jgi:RNA polymerase sigma-70 factor (ECF subfamily)
VSADPPSAPADQAVPLVASLTVRADLGTRFSAGDPDAVRELYRAHGRLVYAVAYRVLGERGLAEEATQQTFVKAWRAAHSFEAGRELGPWLVSIARRAAIDIQRREGVRKSIPIESVPEADPALRSTQPPAEAVLDTWAVKAAVAELPADEREVIRLQHLEGFTHEQISERLGIAVGTVKSRSFRAHKRLAQLLGHLRE